MEFVAGLSFHAVNLKELMEEGGSRGDLHGTVVRQSSIRPIRSIKPNLSGRSTPRNYHSFRKSHQGQTPRREARSSGGSLQWYRCNRVVFWLILIALWAYIGFYVQSKWAHGDNKQDIFGFGSKASNGSSNSSDNNWLQDLRAKNDSLEVKNRRVTSESKDGEGVSNLKNIDVILAKKKKSVSAQKKSSSKRRRSGHSLKKKIHSKVKVKVEDEGRNMEEQEEEISKRNTSYGLLVGPFASIEDRILDWSPEKRSGTCDRKAEFARIVWSRKFVLIFHELSMTGAPLSMLELATELLSCGATVSAVVLTRKGGLMEELARRRVKVLEDRAELSFKASMKADLIIAGSAVCALWIDQYISHYTAGSSQIIWWIMENRQEYFNRSKIVLGQVKMLMFISESQSKQWLAWCEEEKIKLKSQPALVPLSVNDELAFVAGISCSLNTPSFTPEKMLEKRQLLRYSIRKEMGLTDNDMLVMSLSSINPGKGQLLLLESTRFILEQGPSQNNSLNKNLAEISQDKSILAGRHNSRALLHNVNHFIETPTGLQLSNEPFHSLNEANKSSSNSAALLTSIGDNSSMMYTNSQSKRKLFAENAGMQEQALKVLIGSVGSKSNKVPYVKGLLRFLSQHPNLSNSVLWTPATTRVASLYSAADVYITNSQGLGETFGRVTIEAMAFGLPVLGTDAGGSREIIEDNVTGLLHPVGREGTQVLSENIMFLLKNPSAHQRLGIGGRKKVKKMYLKRQMYKKLAEVFFKCMRIK